MHVIKYLYAVGLFQEIQNQEKLLPWRAVFGYLCATDMREH